ncbi:MAG: prepilin-type N-terminal cleavage/methylation domain-containing protein [Candidatus Eisenbacteria sp.]|nr:prepilin-type N-terminal cleavage/methylation domain-containing protein [Candidatus Eisenbacteria bacterium]
MTRELFQETSHAPLPHTGHSGCAGFSMSELMVVLGIAGILVTVALPSFLNMGRRDSVETAAYDLQRTISLARQKAIAKRTQYRVTVDPAGLYCLVEKREAGAWVPDPADTLTFRPNLTMLVSAGGQMSNNDIVIEPQGTVLAQDAPAIITFFNDCGDSTRVSLVRTGRIRVRS